MGFRILVSKFAGKLLQIVCLTGKCNGSQEPWHIACLGSLQTLSCSCEVKTVTWHDLQELSWANSSISVSCSRVSSSLDSNLFTSHFDRNKTWSGAQFVSERSSVLVFLPGVNVIFCDWNFNTLDSTYLKNGVHAACSLRHWEHAQMWLPWLVTVTFALYRDSQ